MKTLFDWQILRAFVLLNLAPERNPRGAFDYRRLTKLAPGLGNGLIITSVWHNGMLLFIP